MKILHYNIWNGCQDDPERLARLGDWLMNAAYDVVGLNELNGWDQPPGMRKRAEGMGYSHVELFVTQRSRTFVGVFSKHAIELVETREMPFWHGVLHARIRDVHYIITHLTPVDAADREKEAMVLAEMAHSIAGPLVLMGDLNTLSPLDHEQHVTDGLVNVFRSQDSLRRKFLTDRQAINYAPMQKLLEAGLIDLGAGKENAYSVPTAVNKDKSHAAKMRLDYILVNRDLLNRSPKVRIINNGHVDSLSDHYPVECNWDE